MEELLSLLELEEESENNMLCSLLVEEQKLLSTISDHQL
jgi:hypothetical protein